MLLGRMQVPQSGAIPGGMRAVPLNFLSAGSFRPSQLRAYHRWSLGLVVAGLLLASRTAQAASSSDAFSQALTKGPIAATLVAFLGGLLVSLTPCIYPMVAVTVSVFGAKKTQSRWQGLALTASFALGIAVMFDSLGLVAALTGTMFGSVLQSPWVVLGIAALFFAMAFSMFGAFELMLPSGLLNRLSSIGGMGYRGAFLLGLVSALVAAPCTGPVLTGILAWIATTRDLALGTLVMTSFAFGLSMPFFAVGAFALELPKSGRWMLTIKSLLGTVLLIVALYFVGTVTPALPRLVPLGAQGWLTAAGLFVAGLVLSLVGRRLSRQVARASQPLSIALIVVAGFCAVTKVTRSESSLSWQHVSLAEAQIKAKTEGLPLLVDFTAAWCGACKELDKLTFSAPEVQAEAGRFIAVKIDATSDEDPAVVAAMTTLAVRGLPTVVLLDSQGKEVRRFTDFVAKGPFLEALRAVQ